MPITAQGGAGGEEHGIEVGGHRGSPAVLGQPPSGTSSAGQIPALATKQSSRPNAPLDFGASSLLDDSGIGQVAAHGDRAPAE